MTEKTIKKINVGIDFLKKPDFIFILLDCKITTKKMDTKGFFKE